jgi:hypothetical protein
MELLSAVYPGLLDIFTKPLACNTPRGTRSKRNRFLFPIPAWDVDPELPIAPCGRIPVLRALKHTTCLTDTAAQRCSSFPPRRCRGCDGNITPEKLQPGGDFAG